MGLFDKISTDQTGSIVTFTQQAKAFATMDLNSIVKMAGQGIVSLITNAVAFFSDVFGHSDCNDQDRVLVERFCDQIPGMWALTTDLGYWDSSVGDQYLKVLDDPGRLRYFLEQMGRPKGAHPCNELIGPARIMFTILLGIRITNSNFLDALNNGVDSYYAAAGWHGEDIPRNAVERAVFLVQNFFPSSSYNQYQWDLNKFQEYPLVAPIPDPLEPGRLYTGEFLGVTVVNGMAIGDPVPDVDQYVNEFSTLREKLLATRFRYGGYNPISISDLPDLTDYDTNDGPGTIFNQPASTTNTTTTTATNTAAGTGSLSTWVKAHPLHTIGIVALVAWATTEIIEHNKK